MARIVILGAGIGGMPAAYELSEKLRPGDKLTVISNYAMHHFTPSNPWVAVDWRKRGDIELDIAPLLAKKKVDFIPVGAKRVHPDKNQIELDDNGACFVALPQIPPRNVNWFSQGKWVHLAKIAFEKYYMRKIKKGTSEHVFEKMVLNALGIMKLKDK